jgi:hypothetical protein
MLQITSGGNTWTNYGRPPAVGTDNVAGAPSSTAAGLIAATDPAVTCQTTYCMGAVVASDGNIWDTWYDSSVSAVKWRMHTNPATKAFGGRPSFGYNGTSTVLYVVDDVGNLWHYDGIDTASSWSSAANFGKPSGTSCTLTGMVPTFDDLSANVSHGWVRCTANAFDYWTSNGDYLAKVVFDTTTPFSWSAMSAQLPVKFYQPLSFYNQPTGSGAYAPGAAISGADGDVYDYRENSSSSYVTTNMGFYGGL